MAKKRSRTDIIHDILLYVQSQRHGAKPTHVMYKANLSYTQLQKYFTELEAHKLIERQEAKDKETIHITPKGINYLVKIVEMKAFEETFRI